jgi:hypothetical protein
MLWEHLAPLTFANSLLANMLLRRFAIYQNLSASLKPTVLRIAFRCLTLREGHEAPCNGRAGSPNEATSQCVPYDNVHTFHRPGTKREHLCSGRDLESVASQLTQESTMTEQVQEACDEDPMEADVTAVIEACGGDPRTAIKALLVEQLIQEQRIERLAAALSFGYVRGRIGVTPGHSGSSHRGIVRP